MKRARKLLLEELGMLALLGVVGCAAPPRTPAGPAPPALLEGRCDAVELRRLVERHGLEYGTAQRVAALLPVQLTGASAQDGAPAPYDEVLTPGAHRIRSGSRAHGVDARGAWLHGTSGVTLRLREDEGAAQQVNDWVARRAYLESLSSGAATLRCERQEGRDLLIAAVTSSRLGDPELVFDRHSTALLEVRFTLVHQRRTEALAAWSDPAHGCRWPIRNGVESLAIAVRAPCDTPCDGAVPDLLVVKWPASGKVVVPMKQVAGLLLVEVELFGRRVWAVVDTGANASVVERTSAAASRFLPEARHEVAGSSQRINVEVGKLALQLGGLSIEGLVAAKASIPGFALFAPYRPELLLGIQPLLKAGARLDFRRSELVLARDAATLRSPRAQALPIRLWEALPEVAIAIEGMAAFALIDTGSNTHLDLGQDWAEARSLRQSRATGSVSYQSGIGDGVTAIPFLRVAAAELGPLRIADRIAQLLPAKFNALVGTPLLARCAAVILDVPNRQLWLEPPCGEQPPELLSGWVLRLDATNPRAPWIVILVVPKGTAAAAGVQVDDRLLRIDGVPVTRTTDVESPFSRQPGTKVQVELLRSGRTLQLELTLRRPLTDDP